jgi:hypothetical protein
MMTFLIVLLSLFFPQDRSENPLFEKMDSERTGITFVNRVEEKPGNNILESEFFFNGGGVAVGDLDQNGFPDLYFTANQGPNALYMNRGNYRFTDIATDAGVEDTGGWTAGAAFADINADGLLDIYVCKAGKVPLNERRNKLYINNGLSESDRYPTFTEQAAQFGLDDPGYCTQPVFFDYNMDGLLDLFIVNYNTRNFQGFDLAGIRNEKDPYAGDKLYRNNGDGTFTNVSEEAGIFQYPIGFGLSATVSDLNGDGYPDIYVANDFMERDYMYINQGDGTFRDEILVRTDVTSYFSMGSDIADINNDGLPDIMVADMLPYDYERRQRFKTPDYEITDQLLANGYHQKNMRNTLQLNRGEGVFSEIGRLAGVEKTDWSWGTLLTDFDNDGYKDLYVTNGFPRYYTDLDYLNDILWKEYPDEDLPENAVIKYELVQQMERVEMQNKAFRNRGNLLYEETTDQWGLRGVSASSGGMYVDLNNNGALDLVISNFNGEPSVYKNNAHLQNRNNFVKIRLEGDDQNRFGIGSKISVKNQAGEIFFQEMYLTRGFQSSADPVLHFGLGNSAVVDIEIIWPDQTRQTLSGIEPNQTITIKKEGAENSSADDSAKKMFALLDARALGLDFLHETAFLRDRIFNPLMPHTLSNLGPALAAGDVNSDGLEDLFVGGGQGQPGAIFLQKTDGSFIKSENRVFELHSEFDDTEAIFFDATGDGLPDLYVVSGGNFDQQNGESYQDRLYINEGFGNFRYQQNALPQMHASGSSVTLLDFNADGRIDLFVGGRVTTGQYPLPPRSFLLENNGGRFTDVTARVAPSLMRPGMVTDAVWVDADGDGVNELIVTGEWMPIRIFKPVNGVYTEKTADFGLEKTGGWWNVLKVADVTGNGLPDIIAGNRGLNSGLPADPENPAMLYFGDFTGNGLNDPLITYIENGKRVPLVSRDLFLRQLPEFKETFPTYRSWAESDVDEILSQSRRKNPTTLSVHTFESSVFINQGNGTFQRQALPAEAQAAPVFDIAVAGFFNSTRPDLLVAGNNFGYRPELGPSADKGLLLRMNEDGRYIPVPPRDSGLYAMGDVRQIEWISTSAGPLFIIARYGDSIFPYLFRPQVQSP